jgi:hypothetical protein
VNRRFGGTYRTHFPTAANCSSWFLTRGFFYPVDRDDTFLRNVSSPRSTRRHIQEDDIIHSHRCEIFKSYNILIGFVIVSLLTRVRASGLFRFIHLISLFKEGSDRHKACIQRRICYLYVSLQLFSMFFFVSDSYVGGYALIGLRSVSKSSCNSLLSSYSLCIECFSLGDAPGILHFSAVTAFIRLYKLNPYFVEQKFKKVYSTIVLNWQEIGENCIMRSFITCTLR